MSAAPELPFAKMNGIGNAILVVDGRGAGVPLTGARAKDLCEGALAYDQLMLIEDPALPGADAAVRIFNGDGSRAGACGNGTRCVGWYLLRDSGANTLALDIDGTFVSCRRDSEWVFTVDMGRPGLDWRDIPLLGPADTRALDLGDAAKAARLPAPAAVSMGNPHAIFFVPDVNAIDLATVGRAVEHHPMFPNRVNASFARVLARDHIELKVWERGAGATRACGSAACAALVAAVRLGKADRKARVSLPGGDLAIEWREDDHVLMTGPVEIEFEGRLAATVLRTLS